MNTWTRLITAIGHFFYRPWLRRRLDRVALETIEGVPLVVLPEVFNPAVFRTGAFLAHTLAHSPELAPSSPEARALDLGTGSGVGAVFAARRGYRTIAVDVNPEAVRCAQVNSLIHHLEDRIETRQGDLFDPVAGEKFELVTFNPPFFRGKPKSRLDMAWRGTDVLERFAARLSSALAAEGRALVVLSTDGERKPLLDALDKSGLSTIELAKRSYGNEDLIAYLVRPH